ncbi:alpha-2-macroglobulin [Aquimarina hainanensis]|uniref:Alpha-2-macroglobulin n=1 Tax=Aquimarina hainanensis TaxID=1578017 RepID=A0ABW5N9X8_9FLAO
MKKIISLLFLLCITNISFIMAQNDYTKQWKEVESHEQKGLPKSSLEVVKSIYEAAKKENNTNQIIKAFLHKAKYALTLEENAQLTIIKELKSEIATSSFPTKNILNGVLANLYWQYFKQNRWKFYNRTHTSAKVDKEDFRTWDLETLFAEIHIHFQQALENGVLAQQTELSKFNTILITEENSKKYRPTLFDFLSHMALEFYKTSETNITRPSYAFEINSKEYLNEPSSFSRQKITTKDSLSLQFNALKIYQQLIAFHSRNKNYNALANVDIERLLFVFKNATFADKEELIINTLTKAKENNKDHESNALYAYELAAQYQSRGSKYIPKKDEVFRWDTKKALELCSAIESAFPNSDGAKKSNALKAIILQAEVSLKSEKNLPIQKAGRLFISYKNTDLLTLKTVKINATQLKSLQQLYKNKDIIKFINGLPEVNTWKAPLKNEKDYQRHTTEILLPALPQGQYLVIASAGEEISVKNQISYADIQVSNLALLTNRTNNTTIFQVVNRNDGAPISNASIHLQSGHGRGYGNKIDKTLTTDKQGQASFLVDNQYYDLVVTVKHEKDLVVFSPYHLYKNHQPQQNINRKQETVFLFTDRSIYRPGQTVYFKGILMTANGNKNHSVVPNTTVPVTLKDVNYQEVSSLKLQTNEYGSFQGSFILPSSGVTGLFHLQTRNGNQTSFSVEEYKRPKFEATFSPVTKTYKLNEIVSLQGNATGYAGNKITDAKVVYRVHRKVQLPRWCYWYYPGHREQAQEITYGETTTDEKGAFEINFEAIPDKSVPKENLPVFHYEITADITDINGETRSTSTQVNVGYHALLANMQLPDKIDKNADNSLTVLSKNLNYESVASSGTIKIYKLKSPQYPLRRRPWNAPDYKILSKEEFTKLFPHDAYDDEDDYKTWDKGALVQTISYNTAEQGSQTTGMQHIPLKNTKKWESGKYVIELNSKDRFGQEVKDIIYYTLFDKKDKKISDQQLFEVSVNKESYSPGEEVIIKFGSASENITITVDVEKNNKITRTEQFTLSNNSTTIKIPVTKEDIGGFAVHYSFVNYNAHEGGTIPITVPYEPTELSIETTTFRDKLLPGQNETWSFTIKGPKGDKVAAELLASMYDVSLDQFKSHQWNFNPIMKPTYYPNYFREARLSFGVQSFTNRHYDSPPIPSFSQGYDRLDWYGLYFGSSYGRMRMAKSRMAAPVSMMDDQMEMANAPELEKAPLAGTAESKRMTADTTNANEKEEENDLITPKEKPLSGVSVRKNLQETAFFFPQLQTNKEGEVSFSFTAPEALTKWKVQLLAHTKTLQAATTTLETVTQKELMVIPSPPRFLREGDKIIISTKVSNLSSSDLNGDIELQLTNALTNTSINQKLQNNQIRQAFSVAASGNTNVSWELQIPDDIQAVQYKIIAKAGTFSDGEQNVLPVLSNRMLVTETLPMWVRSGQTKSFTLQKLKNTTSTSLKHHRLTLEMTSNPAWYAVQALPYLMEYPYDCAEQTFSRYYANALATHIANSNPRIQQVFNQWKTSDALLSNLEKNQELKSLILQETPWVREAQSETEQKKRIALLFDLNKMNSEFQSALQSLQKMQYDSGAFPWFKGGRESRFITQYIAAGFGHLQKLGVTTSANPISKQIVQKAIQYLDQEFVKQYEELKKHCKKHKIDINKNHLHYAQLHYLYMRSFFADIPAHSNTKEAKKYYLGQAKKYWLKNSLYTQGLLALITHRNGDTATATAILNSLEEKSIVSEELGMYWKSNTASWYWHQAPIETQALLIEAFSEIAPEPKKTEVVDNLKIWLLKHKQTNRWKTTKQTAEAVYALLLQGSEWLSITDMVDITLAGEKVTPDENTKVEAGTGYFKTSWSGSEITNSKSTVMISKKGKGIAWGGLYWQYFEDLDKITAAKTPLSLSKKLFLKKNADRGEKMTAITENTSLTLGDLVRVRIELKVDRDMEFIHMKDMRAAGFEPVNVLSQYKWQDGLGYYESTKDAATNFFFDYLPKGVYVFEYDLRVNNKGNFSNGVTTIQSMYAPEFSSHSEGIRVKIEH